MPNIPFEMLNTIHEIEFEVGVFGQLSRRQNDVTTVSEQGTIEIDSMEGTQLDEPSDVVCVFIWND